MSEKKPKSGKGGIFQELEEACTELAKESVEWTILSLDAKKKGKHISDEELMERTSHGAWEKYLKTGGSPTMLNRHLGDMDFGPQYDRLSAVAVRHDEVKKK